MLKLRFGEGRFLAHFGTPFAAFFYGKGPKFDISPTTGSFYPIYFSMILVYYKSTKTPKIM